MIQPKFVREILKDNWARVGERTCMPMVAPTNRMPMWGVVGARCAMCCANVTFKWKFVDRPPIECDGVPCNGLGCATTLDMPLPCRIGISSVIFLGC